LERPGLSAAEVLALARAAGVRVRADRDDLVLEASAAPPPTVLDLLSRHKAGIMALLRSPAPEPLGTPEPIPALTERKTQAGQRRDFAQATIVPGMLQAALRWPPSWSDPATLPSPGCFCSCCRGQTWWSEGTAPKGWRCSVCHPPDHLPADAVMEMTT
jgi:hypothetical protein